MRILVTGNTPWGYDIDKVNIKPRYWTQLLVKLLESDGHVVYNKRMVKGTKLDSIRNFNRYDLVLIQLSMFVTPKVDDLATCMLFNSGVPVFPLFTDDLVKTYERCIRGIIDGTSMARVHTPISKRQRDEITNGAHAMTEMSDGYIFALDGGDVSSLRIPCENLHTLDPGQFLLNSNRERDPNRPKSWLFAENRRGDIPMTQSKTDLSWDKVMLHGHNRVTEDEYIDLQGSVGGEIILSNGIGHTGWWRQRIGFAANNHTLVSLAPAEARMWGDAYVHAVAPRLVEMMPLKLRSEIAEWQRATYFRRTWRKSKFKEAFLSEVRKVGRR